MAHQLVPRWFFLVTMLCPIIAHGAAAELTEPPKGGTQIVAPNSLDGWRVTAEQSIARGKIIDVADMPFAQAWSVETLSRPKVAWGAQLVLHPAGSIAKGDVCLLAFWMRSPKSEDESGHGRATAYVQLAEAPHTKVGMMEATAGPEWRRVFVPFRSSIAIKEGQLGVTFFLGYHPQVVEIGGVELINYGKALSLKELPGNSSKYKGREPDAAWRVEAAERIERIRKGDLTVRVVDAKGQPVSGANVELRMMRHAFGFGSAVTAHMLSVDDKDARRYQELVDRYFNKVVFENDLKWPMWEIGKNNQHDRFRREYVEQGFEFLNSRDIEVRGHYISWAPLKERELTKYKGDPERLRKDLFAHIEEEVPAIGTRVGEWDAVNHIAGWGETLSSFLDDEDIYVDILKASRRLAPDAELWINEGQICPSGRRIPDYEKVARHLIDNGAAPDGLGFMGHFGATTLTPPERLYEVFDRFAAMIPNLQYTELDVDVGDDDELQADYLRDAMTIGFSHEAFQAAVMWGFWEGRHWKPNAALWRRDWSIKPAGEMWIDLVFDQWWSDEDSKTGDDGQCVTRGFLGDYEVTAIVNGKRQTVKIKLPREGADIEVRLH